MLHSLRHTLIHAHGDSQNAWASNDNAAVNAKFATDVKAYFNGIPSGGEYDKQVKSEPQYKVFLEYFQRLVTVVGGDAKHSTSLASDPTNWETYSKWSASVYTAMPMHISFHTTSIWSLMSASPHDILRRYAQELNQAFTWILTHPRVYKTAVIFDIQSDCKSSPSHYKERGTLTAWSKLQGANLTSSLQVRSSFGMTRIRFRRRRSFLPLVYSGERNIAIIIRGRP